MFNLQLTVWFALFIAIATPEWASFVHNTVSRIFNYVVSDMITRKICFLVLYMI